MGVGAVETTAAEEGWEAPVVMVEEEISEEKRVEAVIWEALEVEEMVGSMAAAKVQG